MVCFHKQDTINSIAENYYASVYTGIPGTDNYDKMLRDWLNVQTDNLLADYVSDIEMPDDMVLALVSTINYNAKWAEQFYKENTKKETFHASTEDIKCDFMKS